MSSQAPYPISPEEPEQAASIGDLLAVARRHLWLIVGFTLIGLAIAAGIAWTTPLRFDAHAAVLVDPRRKTIVKETEVVSELPAESATVESEVEILQSRAVIGRVVEQLGLRYDPEFNGESLTTKLRRKLGAKITKPTDLPQQARNHIDPELSAEPELDGVLEVVSMHVKVQRRRNTYLIEVAAHSRDPVKAARIANAVVDSYLKLQLETKVKQTGTATDWLERKLEGLRQKVVESERAVAQFKAQHELIDSENGQRLEDRQIARLMEQAVIARTQLAETKAKYVQVQKLMALPGAKTAAADVLESATIRLLKDQLVKVTRREAELQTRYGPKHPEMLKIKAELRDIEKQMELEVDQILSNYKSAYEVADQRERSLTAQLEAMKSGQAVINDASVRLRDLEREAAATRSLYEAFLARYKQTAEQQSLNLADSRLIEAATVPLAPSGPKRMKFLAIGFMGGLASSIGLIFLLEMMYPGLRRPEDFERASGLDHIASLPDLTDASGKAGSLLAMARHILARPEGPFAEAVRTLAHAVDLRWRAGGGRTILLASSLPGEGKSALASNLALHYATTGARALLIDCDLRRASLTRTLLPRPAETGLYDCLAWRLPVEQAILRDPSTGLCFLPASGAAAPAASVPEMLASPALHGLLHRLRHQFDVVVLDSPPILPVVDTRILADQVDQIAFVAAWRRTPRDVLRRALRLMSPNAAKLTGLMINKVDPSELGSAYGYGVASYRAGRRKPRALSGPAKGQPAFARGPIEGLGVPTPAPARGTT